MHFTNKYYLDDVVPCCLASGTDFFMAIIQYYGCYFWNIGIYGGKVSVPAACGEAAGYVWR